MRNLKLQYCNEHKAVVPNAKHLLLQPDIERTDNELSYIVTDSKIYVVDDAKDEEPKIVAEVPDIVSAEYLQLDNVICVATSAGEVMLISPDTLATNEGTYCDVGIECMAWSPNQEVVAFITKAKNVVVMTSTYDVLGEQPLDASLASDQQFVNVGWGKKETQFHGSAGKQAAKQSIDFKPPQDVHLLPQTAHIAWRGDGAFFAVSYVASNVGRTFSVYDSEGKLHYMAERWNGLQAPLAWRPSGNWIAVPQLLEGKSQVALFEKNGLLHREIPLPFDLSEEPIVQLSWSADSDILALHTETPEVQRIYLYTIGNYHWYLKQVLRYEQPDSLAFFHWDNRLGAEHMLHVVLQSGKRQTHRWIFAVDAYHSATVCVIDGKRLMITDLSKSMVPPPMCQRVIELDSYINAVASTESELYMYTSDRELYYHIFDNPKLIAFMSPPSEELAEIQLANLCGFTDTKLIATQTVAGKSSVLLIHKGFNKQHYVASSMPMQFIASALTRGPHKKSTIFIQSSTSHRIYELTDYNGKLKPVRVYAELTQFADHMECYNSLFTQASAIISLRSQQLLHVDGKQIGEDVTSFCVAGDYLVYTQLNAMHFVHMADQRLVSTRSIERGAKLVAHAGDARLVLQLPRGNLEVIYPRLLVLQLIAYRLQSSDYQNAMRLVRKHRINHNIICDYNMKKFVQDLRNFLKFVDEIEWICLFISELQNEDYALGMYAGNFINTEQNYPEDYSVQNKVEYICRRLCAVMKEVRTNQMIERYRLPIISAYVKLGEQEAALRLIWEQKQKDAQLADQLLKYLLYLVDVNELYNVALGTYDFGLVLFVAQKTQKDPKEFLPYLNELKSLPPDYRKFKIDEHLKRYDSAVQHLAACGEPQYELALDFIKQHNLYEKAVTVYQDQLAFRQRIFVAYADHLRANAQLEAASLMYERGGQLQQAALSARHTLDWQRVLQLSQRVGEPLEQVAQSLVAPLQQQDRHLEAYELLKRFGPPESEAPVQALLQGHLYGRAICEAVLLQAAGASDPLENIVKPALIEYVEQLRATLDADCRLFVQYKERLQKVRQMRAAQGEGGGFDGEPEVDIDEADLISDTTSVHSSRHSNSSRGTGKTFRSSKNRRKHERKLLSLKPGNPFEDIALIDALHNQVTKLAEQQQQQLVRDTCKALLQLHTEDSRAAALQKQYGNILSEVLASLDEIWIPELMGGTAQHLTGPNVDYLTLRKEQRYVLISPLKRFKPQLKMIDWQLSILK